MKGRISVCMITHNKKRFVARSVPAIYNSITYGDVEFIVMDNGSTDGTIDVLYEMSKSMDIVIHRVSENVGLNGYSIVTEMATGDIIVTADDDIFYVSDGWERFFVSVFTRPFGDHWFGYVGSTPVNSDGGLSPLVYGVARYGDITVRVAPVGGWFAATTRKVMNRVGGFHSGKSVMHLEDADYQSLVVSEGFLVGYCENIRVFHARGESYFSDLGHLDTYNRRLVDMKKSGLLD